MRAAKSMVKGKGHDRGTLAKGKASSSAASEAQKGWAAWYLDNCKASLDKRQKLFEEKYSAFKQGSIEDVDCKAWLYIAKFAYLLGLDILCSPKCPTRTDHFVSSPIPVKAQAHSLSAYALILLASPRPLAAHLEIRIYWCPQRMPKYICCGL